MKKTFLILLTAIIFCSIFMSSCSEGKGKSSIRLFRNNSDSIDFSYKSMLSKINYPEVPYYGYNDAREMSLRKGEKEFRKYLNNYNDSESFETAYDDYYIRELKNGIELVYADLREKIPSKILGEPVIKLGGELKDDEYPDGNIPDGEEEPVYRGYYTICDDNYDTYKIKIPSTVKEIVYGTFESMPVLEKIEVSKDNPYYSSVDGILYNKDKTTLLCIPRQYPKKTINIPDGTVNVYSLFSEKTRTVNIPKSVKKIACAFRYDKYGKEYKHYNKTYDTNIDDDYIIEAFNVDKKNKNYSSEKGVLYNKSKTELLAYPYAKDDKSFTVPDSVKTISSIDMENFSELNTLYLGKNIKKIGLFSGMSCYPSNIHLTVYGYKNSAAYEWCKKIVSLGNEITVRFKPINKE